MVGIRVVPPGLESFLPPFPALKRWAKVACPSGAGFLDEQGSELVEFAVTLPLLVVFVVGIYDFSGAFNQKQKIAQAAQEGAIIAGAQPMSDIQATNGNPDSLQPVVTAIVNSLAGSGVVNAGACQPPFPAPAQAALKWTYTITGCSSAYPSDPLAIVINRGWACASGPCTPGTPVAVGTVLTVSYPYHWRFGGVIQLLFPGPNGYSTPATVTESATVHNQM